jgi:hypothetical protein
MGHLLVAYDLHSQRTYPPVCEKLESWGAARLLESVWLVTVDITAAQARDALKAVVDAKDAVAVIELQAGSGWASLRIRDAGLNWLRRNIHA